MTQDSENWNALQALFHLAEDVPECDLDALLLGACADPELRRRAKALILAERIRPVEAAPALDGRIGPYSVIRSIGSGGIGTVYMVERIAGGALQRAALKVLSLHAAGPFFANRFAREQHVLASLEHPNITRMLDAGVSDSGQPYLVMEYVDGVHLDTFCDDHALGIPARLKLFLQVGEAVAYAHRNLIVHLDLKPSNILVARAQVPANEGTVKLLDFGTSKLIQPDSLLTTTVMATPAYASPEQLRNEVLTTACDVYALGAILFELLSGRRPNQDSSVAIMIERSFREVAPEPVTGAVTPAAAERRGLTQTRLLSLLRGDLATIVAKCLNPRPKDRYASVDALIADIERHLAGRPILARPQTTTYRLTKFVRRNSKGVVAGVIAVLALIATSSYALWRQEQAVREGRRAVQMQTFMYRLFKLANSNYMGKPAATVQDFLQLGVRVLPDFIKDPADLRSARLSLAESLFDNDDFAHAQPVFTQVISDAKAVGDIGSEAEAEGFAGDVAYNLGQGDLGGSLTAHAYSLVHQRGVTPSERVWIEVYYVENRADRGIRSDEDGAILKSAVAEARTERLPERETAFSIGKLADYLSQRGDLNQAQGLAEEVYGIYGREPYAFCDQADTAVLLANIRYNRSDYAGSLPLYKQGYEGFKACAGPDNLNTLSLQVLMARDMLKLGQAQAVVPMLEAALPIWRKTLHDNTDIVAPLVFLARAYIAVGAYTKAVGAIEEALKVQQGKVTPNSTRVAVFELLWAQALVGEQRPAEALIHAETADKEYAGIAVMTPAEKVYAAQAHQLALDLRSSHGDAAQAK
jgi:serine/threonine protein kinase/tetratricopeptide (TPR) repeat protein